VIFVICNFVPPKFRKLKAPAFLPDSVLVDSEEGYGYQQFFTDGKKGKLYMSIPSDSKRTILQVRQLGLKRL